MTEQAQQQLEASPAEGGRFLAWLQLVRLPNVFTAFADILMGFLVTHPGLSPAGPLVLLLACSGCLYMAGMVLNDVFDVEQDRQQRPGRPIPSGRISLGWARLVGVELLIIGAAIGWTAGYLEGDWRPGLVATALAASVLLYDAVLKNTAVAPLIMGGCRFLNVLLGMSLVAGSWFAYHWLIAGGIGTYIVGVTWFARHEARQSSRLSLALATAVLLGGMALLAWHPLAGAGGAWTLELNRSNWLLMWSVLAVMVGWRCVRAVFQPEPALVQAAVKICILSLITLDAVIAYGYSGHEGIGGLPYAAIILLLLLPAMFLGRWVYST